MKFRKGTRNMILEQFRSGVYNLHAQLTVANFSRGSAAPTQVRQSPVARALPLSLKPPLSNGFTLLNPSN